MDFPQLNSKIFWDTNKEELNGTKYANAVIVRVLERGTLSDWNEIKRFYGHKKIKEAAIKARNLSKKTLHFVSAI